MSNIFEGTGVKRYIIRHRESYVSPWEYPSDLRFDTLTEAKVVLSKVEGPRNNYEIAEVWPSMRYEPGAEYRRSPLLDKLLSQAGFQPYALQRRDSVGRWETCFDLQFGTLEEAQAAAGDGPDLVAAMVLVERYEAVRDGK